MTRPSYYELLGVRRGASDDEIRDAWRQRARELHPDRNPDDSTAAEAFSAAAEAWATLRDPVLRRRYDLGGMGSMGARHADTQPSLGEVLRRVASAAGRSMRARRGEDIHLEVVLSVEEALAGCTRVLELPRAVNPGSDVPTVEIRRLEFALPPGARPAQRLRWRREGGPGLYGAPPGDLHITVRHESHPWLRMEPEELVATVPIRLGERLAGTTLVVPVGSRRVRVEIPPAHAVGMPIWCEGQGWPKGEGEGRGRLRIELRDDVPTGPLGEKALAALQAFERLLDPADRDDARLAMDAALGRQP